MNNCRNCAKIFCEKRDEIDSCDKKITFVQANLLNPPTKIEKDCFDYGGITMEEACKNIQKSMEFFCKTIGGLEDE